MFNNIILSGKVILFVPETDDINITVYDLLGKKIKSLFSRTKESGNHYIKWDGKNETGIPVASGVYLYRISSQNFSIVGKMILLK